MLCELMGGTKKKPKRELTPPQLALRKARRLSGLTQFEVDDAAGWPRTTMSQLETTRQPTDEHLRGAARVFGIRDWTTLKGSPDIALNVVETTIAGASELPHLGLLPGTVGEVEAQEGITMKKIPGQYDPRTDFAAQVSGSLYAPMFLHGMILLFRRDAAKRPDVTLFVRHEDGRTDLAMIEGNGGDRLRLLSNPGETLSLDGWSVLGRLFHFYLTDEAGIRPYLVLSEPPSRN
jgi:transcriptional regulator with XRE-family HTH domain